MDRATLRDRLRWDGGAVFDGDRRYLLMRPDVLMGAAVGLADEARAAWLQALAQAAQEQGGRSLDAYAAQVGDDATALIATTTQAAADLGWGRWQIERGRDQLGLSVTDSPFVMGWRMSGGPMASLPLCAPIEGLLQALALRVLGPGAHVREVACAACGGQGDSVCRFEAHRT